MHQDKEINIEDWMVEWQEEGRHLTEEELALMESTGESQAAFKDMMLFKQAIIRESEVHVPDVNMEWEQFSKNKRRHKSRTLWSIASGVAATLLIAVLYLWVIDQPAHEELLVYKAIEDMSDVTLTVGDKSLISLDGAVENERLKSAGTIINEEGELEYIKEGAVKQAEMHVLTTPKGKDFKIVLSDGTTVWLNADSRLEYPSVFEGSQRMVHLEGEAYFDVAKDAEHPFVVRTADMQARVLGTELNVSSYTGSEHHITLITGAVEVCSDSDKRYKSLVPGEEASLKADGSFEIKQVDTDKYLYWKDGYFYFDNITLMDMMKVLGSWYNVNVIFEDVENKDLLMHYFCMRNVPLEENISLLNHMPSIQAKLVNNTIYIR